MTLSTPEEQRQQQAQRHSADHSRQCLHPYRLTDGARVFLISPYDPELDAEQTSGRSAKPRSRRPNPEKRRDRSQQVDYR